jgi:hypothetical protein
LGGKTNSTIHLESKVFGSLNLFKFLYDIFTLPKILAGLSTAIVVALARYGYYGYLHVDFSEIFPNISWGFFTFIFRAIFLEIYNDLLLPIDYPSDLKNIPYKQPNNNGILKMDEANKSSKPNNNGILKMDGADRWSTAPGTSVNESEAKLVQEYLEKTPVNKETGKDPVIKAFLASAKNPVGRTEADLWYIDRCVKLDEYKRDTTQKIAELIDYVHKYDKLPEMYETEKEENNTSNKHKLDSDQGSYNQGGDNKRRRN